MGACPACKGFGRIIAIDYHAAIPDRSKTLAGGAVKPWQTKTGAECQTDMTKFAKLRKVPMNVAFRDLPKNLQDWVVEGDPGYGKDEAHKWPRAWYGVKGYFRWLESKAYKMHVPVLLARYRKYDTLPGLPRRTISTGDVALPDSRAGRRRRPDAGGFLPAAGAGRRLTVCGRTNNCGSNNGSDRRFRSRRRLALEEVRSRLATFA